MSYIIETRTPETEERRAGEWHSDGMGEGLLIHETEEAALSEVEELRALGPDYAAHEYRVREMTPREMVALVRQKGGVFAELAGHMDALLDESDRRQVQADAIDKALAPRGGR